MTGRGSERSRSSQGCVHTLGIVAFATLACLATIACRKRAEERAPAKEERVTTTVAPSTPTPSGVASTALEPPLFTSDLTDGFFEELVNGCNAIGCHPDQLLSVWLNESGVRANAHNPAGDASGLCQFMPATLAAVGWTHKTPDGKPDHGAFRRLTAEEQLPYVFNYYAHFKGYLVSATNDYVVTFLPAQRVQPEVASAIICCAAPPCGLPRCPPPGIFPVAYGANTTFDREKKGAIDRDDLDGAVQRACRVAGKRCKELMRRLEAATGRQSTSEVTSRAVDLGGVTPLASQRAGAFEIGTGGRTIAVDEGSRLRRIVDLDARLPPELFAASAELDGASTMSVAYHGDMLGDGREEALIELDSFGNGCGPSYFIAFDRPERGPSGNAFTSGVLASCTFGGARVTTGARGTATIVVRGVDGEMTYVVSMTPEKGPRPSGAQRGRLQVSKANARGTIALPAVEEIDASRVRAAPGGVFALGYDVDADGKEDAIECMLGRNMICTLRFTGVPGVSTQVASRRLGVLPSKTNGIHDLVVDDDTVERWSGRDYE